jgi:hypothetical protein
VPGHGDALLLPAGELGRQVADPLAEPDLLQGLPGSLAALGRLDPEGDQGGFRVRLRRQGGIRLKVWKMNPIEVARTFSSVRNR